MRRAVISIYILCACFMLSGCQGNLFSSHRDMERLRPVQTLGIDRHGSGVTLSVCTGTGPDNAPSLVMESDGTGIEDAIGHLQDWSPEDELFYAHVRYILLGEDMTSDGIMPLLDWVERSPAMRMDTAMFVVRGRAGDAVTGASAEESDITKRLASLERQEIARGRHIYTLREIASRLMERGSALCLVMQTRPSEGVVFTEPASGADAVIPTGYAVLRQDAAAVCLTGDETLGAQLLTEGVSGEHIAVDGNAMDIISGGGEVTGQWNGDGTLAGILVKGELRAGILEREGGGEEDLDLLQSGLTEAARAWLLSAVTLSQELDCDFLDLEAGVMKNAPADGGVRWKHVFSTLPVTVLVDAQIDRSYDLSYETEEP